ncbi:H-2 class II histocompatibility antigen, A-K alpha chain-like [Hoplias malabaricus]|uniref:H-2 class II histocompatibility antigen, A-K alpha chain-like n=1 Tax=Hoplias malabaricus TaxID=27720 RepID=UPI00346365AE
MKLCLILVCAALLYTVSAVKYQDLALTFCSDSEREKIYGVDGEEKWHADFSLEEGVMTLPQFVDPFSYEEGAYEGAVSDIKICYKRLFAPQSSVYTKSSVQLGSKNTLICHITGFYPPHVEVSWTRNNVNVTDEASLSRYYINTEDGTFKLVSTLSFTPEEGDIYSCSVQHTALDRALTRTWGEKVDVELPGVFCGVGLAGGLLGVTVGTFFFIKGNNCNRIRL